MAVAALVLWLCTAAVGSYMLATATRSRNTAPAPPDPVSVSAEQPVSAEQAATAAPATPVRAKDRWDAQSLRDAKAEPMPGLKDLAEFAHPTLAMIGFGFWFGYVVSHNRVFLAISLGILLGAICAGLSWFTVNTRAAKRAAVEEGDGPAIGPLVATPRLIILHAVGAGLTLLIAALIAARV